jgi:hypothetical protein
MNGTDRKMPAYEGAVFLYHGARFAAGFGEAEAR